ncbi:nucleotidyltransferase domain-containing protein [Candidatus Woesebacteria bacterium]|nr:MAG: nucleotidyltransferase domain-containing protein [Candidatus Woesebacteria bacterium]
MDEESPYLETHRFQINETSKVKLRKFRKLLTETQTKHPEIIAATVFGSQIIGKATDISDIDAVVFVDVNKAGLSDKPDALFSDTRGDQNWEQVNGQIGDVFRNKASKLLPSAEAKQGIKLRLISEARINNEMDNLINYQQQIDAKKADGGISSVVERSRSDIHYLFHLQIGGSDLEKYRCIVLDRLAALGELGDEIWRDRIVFGVQFDENARLGEVDRTSNELFPLSIEKAREKFGTYPSN